MAEFLEDFLQLFLRQIVQHHQAFSFFLVRNAGDDEGLLGGLGELVKFFLDLDVRHHLASDFAETGQPVGDLDEAVLVQAGDVAGHIPAVSQDVRRLLWPSRDIPA